VQIQAYDYERHLEDTPLPPVILLFGDEPQQKLDIIDAVRKKVKNIGFDERQSFTLDSDFEWNHLIDAMQSMSLFADKQYIELNMTSTKPGTIGAKQLVHIASMASPDVLLLINGPKAGKDVQKTKWFGALANTGWLTLVYDLQHSQIQRWLSARANSLNLRISQQALGMIADLCEGNLMAGRQELEKLGLQFAPEHVIDEKDIAKVMVQQSRYTTFQFTDEILRGDMQKAVKMLGRLEDEGTEPVVILWSIVNEAQTVTKLLDMQAIDGFIDYKSLRIWSSKQTLYQAAVSRLNLAHMHAINEQLSQADIMFKSAYVAKPFVVLSHLALLFMPANLSEFSLVDG
jgi:DNA polymerase-3 subunit delta